MNARIESGKLVVPIAQLLESLSAEDRDTLIQALSCESEVIVNVVDQLVDGFTRDVSHGFSDVLLEQRKRILEAVDEVRFRVVRELMNSLAASKFSESRSSNWAWKLWDAWPEDHIRSRPQVPSDWNPNYPSDEDIMREMRR